MLAMDDANLPDPRRTLNELGFDSLTGVEFCNRVGRSIGQQLNPAVLFDYPTWRGLPATWSATCCNWSRKRRRKPSRTKAEAEKAVDEIQEQALAEVENMSEEEMDALVAAQLRRLQG